MKGFVNATHTVFRFKRKLDTCDINHDVPITVSNKVLNYLSAKKLITYTRMLVLEFRPKPDLVLVTKSYQFVTILLARVLQSLVLSTSFHVWLLSYLLPALPQTQTIPLGICFNKFLGNMFGFELLADLHCRVWVFVAFALTSLHEPDLHVIIFLLCNAHSCLIWWNYTWAQENNHTFSGNCAHLQLMAIEKIARLMYTKFDIDGRQINGNNTNGNVGVLKVNPRGSRCC